MNNRGIELASSSWDDAEYKAIQDVVDSGMFTMGPRVKEFEEKFAASMGAEYAVMVNSGSSANLLMVAALFYRRCSSLQRGDEVIVPAVSWSTTYYPLYQYGLKIKFVDIDLETLNYDLDALATAITSETKAIMVVNLLGNPNQFDVITQLIGGREIILLEDNCESMGATYSNKMAGTYGIMGTFSTFFSHHISTMEGGLVVTNDEEIYHILLSLRAHGWTRNLPSENLVCEKNTGDEFYESFRFVLPGYNLRPLEMSGAIGVHQLRKLPGLIEGRRKNAEFFKKKFSDNPKVFIQHEIGISSWFGFSLVVRDPREFERQNLIHILRDLEIDCRPIVAGNFANNEVCGYFDSTVHGSLVNAQYVDSNGLFIGNQHYDITAQLDRLHQALS